MNYLQDDDPLGTVFEEVGHLLFERGLHLVLGDDFQMIPGCFAAPFHLNQVLLELIKVHLRDGIGRD